VVAEKTAEEIKEEVLPVSAPASEAQAVRKEIKILKRDIRYIKSDWGQLEKKKTAFYQDVKVPGTSSAEGALIPSGIELGLGVKPVAVQKYFYKLCYPDL
jgi:hypothetical protein